MFLLRYYRQLAERNKCYALRCRYVALAEIVHAARARLSDARLGDGLKAAEMLAKLTGWNEPERVDVQSVEVKVDAALIEQLRAGYAELGRRQQQQLGAMVAATNQNTRV